MYKKQFAEWQKKNPNATIEEAWMAGYWQLCDNWCSKRSK